MMLVVLLFYLFIQLFTSRAGRTGAQVGCTGGGTAAFLVALGGVLASDGHSRHWGVGLVTCGANDQWR